MAGSAALCGSRSVLSPRRYPPFHVSRFSASTICLLLVPPWFSRRAPSFASRAGRPLAARDETVWLAAASSGGERASVQPGRLGHPP